MNEKYDWWEFSTNLRNASKEAGSSIERWEKLLERVAAETRLSHQERVVSYHIIVNSMIQILGFENSMPLRMLNAEGFDELVATSTSLILDRFKDSLQNKADAELSSAFFLANYFKI